MLARNLTNHMLMEIKKFRDIYEAPSMVVVEVKQEGVICQSGDVPATMNGLFVEETI